MLESIDSLYRFTKKLPMAPERIAFWTGTFCAANAIYDIEFGNPILGGIEATLGALTIYASLNTKAAHEALDNRGSL